MGDRAAQISSFLASAGWGDALRAPLAGDASNRRYDRLSRGLDTAILMDASPDRGEDVRPFLSIARHLSSIGLSAPEIYAKDAETGLLLIEDLGDTLFSTVLARDTGPEEDLYRAATDTLIALHAAAPPETVPDYGPETMVKAAGLASDWYGFGATDVMDAEGRAAIATGLRVTFDALPAWKPVLVLRDYHAENLLWLPERSPQSAKTGLLDFQDAGIGHPAYDLMSLVHDVRRRVAPTTRAAMIRHYADTQGIDQYGFSRACAAMSAQRNLRILGVFARLSMHFGKPRYVDLIPTVWSNLMVDLSHPALDTLRVPVTAHLPDPTPHLLEELKRKCGTIRHL